MKIDGKEIASKIIEDLKNQKKPGKILAAICVGNRADSKSFLRQKELIAQGLGVPFELFQFGEDILEADLIKEIKKIGADRQIGGLIIQLPLPKHYNRDKILAAINPKQDVDALTKESRKYIDPLPVAVVKDILSTFNFQLSTSTVAVVGKGFLVGKPIINWLNGKCDKLIVFDSKSDLSKIKEADLIITGVGNAGLIKPEMLKSGAAVIDFGYDLVEVKRERGKVESKIRGDFDSDNIRLSTFDFGTTWYTPTPGGTGPILVAEIFKNFFKLNS